MSALARLQRDFCAAVQDDSEDGPGYAAYRHTYRAQLLACLQDTFPVLAGWLGEEDFTALAIAYALACPPASWSLDHFPARFPGWLAEQGESAVAAELARIEWALAASFVAPDAPVLSAEDLATLDWDHARLALAASCHLLALTTPAAAIWVAAQEGAPCAAPGAAPAPVTVLIWRRDEQCYLHELAGDEASLLARCPADFAELCALASARLGEEEGPQRIGALLAQWVTEGVLARPDAEC